MDHRIEVRKESKIIPHHTYSLSSKPRDDHKGRNMVNLNDIKANEKQSR